MRPARKEVARHRGRSATAEYQFEFALRVPENRAFAIDANGPAWIYTATFATGRRSKPETLSEDSVNADQARSGGNARPDPTHVADTSRPSAGLVFLVEN